MNILVVNDYGFAAGGAELLIAAEREELEKRGHRTDLFSLDSEDLNGPADRWVLPYQDPTGRLPATLLQLGHARAARAIAGRIERFRPDLIHFHNVRRLSAAVLAPARDVASLLTLHDYGVMYPLLRAKTGRSDFCGVGDFACCRKHAGVVRYSFEVARAHQHLNAFRYLRRVIAPSAFVKRVADQCGIQRVVRCPNGISRPRFAVAHTPTRQEILYAGRYEREKGVFALVDAFEAVADELPAAELLMAGQGGKARELKARVLESRHASRVRFLGQLYGEELAVRYAAARVVVMPSLWPEPFGLAGIEAMLAGTPVVGSGRGGMTEWLQHGRTGLIVDPEDKAAFAAALTRVLTKQALHSELSRASLRSASAFGITSHVDALEAIYHEARR